MFIKQVFFGVLRYIDFLKVFTTNLTLQKPLEVQKKDHHLFHVFAYLTIFRLNELPIGDYKALVLVS